MPLIPGDVRLDRGSDRVLRSGDVDDSANDVLELRCSAVDWFPTKAVTNKGAAQGRASAKRSRYGIALDTAQAQSRPGLRQNIAVGSTKPKSHPTRSGLGSGSRVNQGLRPSGVPFIPASPRGLSRRKRHHKGKSRYGLPSRYHPFTRRSRGHTQPNYSPPHHTPTSE